MPRVYKSTWSKEDDDFILRSYGHIPASKIGAALRRSKNAIIGRFHRLNPERRTDEPPPSKWRTHSTLDVTDHPRQPYLHNYCTWRYYRDNPLQGRF